MTLDHVKRFLEAYKNLTPPHKAVKKEFIRVANTVTGVVCEGEEIEVLQGTIRINTTPHKRNIIFRHKEKILKELADVCGPQTPTKLL